MNIEGATNDTNPCCRLAILTVYKQVFSNLNFANNGRKESFVSTVNEPLVGTLSTIGNVTVSIAIEWSLEFKGKTDACCSNSCPFVTCPF